MATVTGDVDAEKAQTKNVPSVILLRSSADQEVAPRADRLTATIRSVEGTLLKYNVEARGIQRVQEDEKKPITWLAYVQIFMLWTSINLVVNNITLGMLGPAVFELSFKDSSTCAALGGLLGSLPVAWISTWGPLSGLRTMVWARYSMGWYPSRLVVVLNIILMLGYSVLVCIIGGQVLSAVSPNGSLSVVVGIIIVAVLVWAVTTFGISIFHYYERYAWVPQIIAISILYGVSARFFDLSTPSQGDSRTVNANRLSFFSLCASNAITYSGNCMDFLVYWPTKMSRPLIFLAVISSLTLSFTLSFIAGVGLASGINTSISYSNAWTEQQGGSGSGALLVEGFATIGNFGKFLAVIVALGAVGNTIPATYAAGIDFQTLGHYFARVPRVVWNTIGVTIYTVCAVAGRNKLAIIFTNFLALMGYWVAIWVSISLEEYFIFRRMNHRNYDWRIWNDRGKLSYGIAALTAFLVGWAGAILCMAQVWYVGPIARLVGEYGADMGNFVGFTWAALVYPPLRWLELKKFGR